MKTIGLLGGMSWESSAEYYRLINQMVHQRLGGHHSAKSVMVSVDFAEIEALQMRSAWSEASLLMQQAARQCERAGADFLVICTNTMHKVADEVQATISMPILHIADATASAVKQKHLSHIGLLGTAFTMEQDFYKGRLVEQHGLNVLIPNDEDRKITHDVIYDELVHGVIREEAREQYIRIIKDLQQAGAEGVILGCTEIGLLIKPEHSPIPTFDTTELHALAAVEMALA